MVRGLAASLLVVACGYLTGCHGAPPPPGTLVVVIESSPNNLDPRQGTDAQSERVAGLIFDALVKKDEHYNLAPWLATSWEQPDPLTWVFHLRDGVHFQDGRPLEAADVAWTIDSLIDPKLCGLISAKSGSFAAVERVEARDRLTVVVHMKRPDAGLLFNMSDGPLYADQGRIEIHRDRHGQICPRRPACAAPESRSRRSWRLPARQNPSPDSPR